MIVNDLNALSKRYFDLKKIKEDLLVDLHQISELDSTNSKFIVRAYDYMDDEGDELEFYINISSSIELLKYKLSKDLKYDYIDFTFYIYPKLQKIRTISDENEKCIFEMDYQYRDGKFVLINYGIFYDSYPFSF